MTLIVIFIVSGLAISTLVIVKSSEEKRGRPFFISRAISKGDIHTREIYHKTVRFYSEGKERAIFFYQKRIPIHSRNLLNKGISFLSKKRDQYANNMRDSKLLRKSDGLSEFFKNMSDVEKGNGEIHDVYDDAGPNNQDRPVGRGSQNNQKELE